MRRGCLLRSPRSGGAQASRSSQARPGSGLSSSEGWPRLAARRCEGKPSLVATEVYETSSEQDPMPAVLMEPEPARSSRLLLSEDQRCAFVVSTLQMLVIEWREALTGKSCTWCGLPTGSWCDDCEGLGCGLTPLCTDCETHLRKCRRCWCCGNVEVETRLRVTAAEMLQGSPALSVFCAPKCAMGGGFLWRPGRTGGDHAPRSAQACPRSSLSSPEGWAGLAATSGEDIPALPATGVHETFSEEDPLSEVLAGPGPRGLIDCLCGMISGVPSVCRSY